MHNHRLAAFGFYCKTVFPYLSLGPSVNFLSLTVESISSVSLFQLLDVKTFQTSQKLVGNFTVLSFL